MDLNRLKHSLSVANKMIEIGKKKGLNDIQLQELFILGYNHDIGYRFATDKSNHNIIGGEMLRDTNYKYWQEVYNHGNPDTDYTSMYLDILNQADMQIDKSGNEVSYEERLEDIKQRYGINSIQYINSKKIIEKNRKEEWKMKETYEFLKEKTQVNFVATINGDKPSNRPFGDPFMFEDKIYVLTNKQKEVSKQIAKNNNVCIVAYDNENWIRINCELIDDSDNIRAKEKALEEFEWAEEAGYTLDNPDFQILYMKNVDSTIYDEDGNVIGNYKF